MSTYTSNKSSYGIYIKDDIDGVARDTGYTDLVIAHLVTYLRDNFPLFAASSNSAGTTTSFFSSFPEDKNLEVTLPAIVMDVRSDDYIADSIGFVQHFVQETGEIIYGLESNIVLELDIWANNQREKKVLQGLLINQFHAGMITQELRRRGIRNIKFIRSVPRGYDQTDRVLQFHTHQLKSDDIFRQVMEFEIQFDHQIVIAFAENYLISQVIFSEESGDTPAVISFVNNNTFQLTFNVDIS